MEEMYGLHPTAPDYSPENPILPSDYRAVMIINSTFPESHRLPVFGSDDELISAVSADPPYDQDPSSSAIKAKIAAHRDYPRLLKSYIDCYKVVAPPEMGQVLEEIRRESDVRRRQEAGDTLGVDPELDEFMDTYCEVLDQYKSDLSRPFDEAKTFLSEIETELRDLCNGDFVTTSSGDSHLKFSARLISSDWLHKNSASEVRKFSRHCLNEFDVDLGGNLGVARHRSYIL